MRTPAPSSVAPRGAVALSTLLAFAVQGCATPDADQRFSDYVDRVANHDTSVDALPDITADVPQDVPTDEGDAPCIPVEVEFTPQGTWFLAVSANLDRARPLYIQVDIVPDGDDWRFTFQPLSTDEVISEDGTERTPREDNRQPAGDAFVVPGVAVDAEGNFEVTVENLIVQDEANPITGRLIRGSVTLSGQFTQDNWACGAVSGQIVEPLSINLNGSTFGMYRGDEAFPELDPIRYRCQDAPAAPPVECEEPDPGPDPVECDPFDANGTYFLAVSANLDRARPLYLRLTNDNGTFTFQPLTTDEVISEDGTERSPRANNREPVGNPIVVPGVTVGSDGSFTVTAADLSVADEANPITGRLIRGTVTLTGNFRSTEWACGAVTGQIVEPLSINLNGSNFGMVRSDDPKSIDTIRYSCALAPPPTDCDLPQ